MSPETFERLQSLRRKVYDSHDYQEGIRSFLERRKPAFTGESAENRNPAPSRQEHPGRCQLGRSLGSHGGESSDPDRSN